MIKQKAEQGTDDGDDDPIGYKKIGQLWYELAVLIEMGRLRAMDVRCMPVKIKCCVSISFL